MPGKREGDVVTDLTASSAGLLTVQFSLKPVTGLACYSHISRAPALP
ncbi:MAG: hypothetical protein WBB50_11345 [Methyloceanibacter sp.]